MKHINTVDTRKAQKMVDVENAKLLANQLVKLAAESLTKLAKIIKKVSN